MEGLFGPLIQLEVQGLLCPCLQKEENRNALQAVKFLRGRRVRWIRNDSASLSAKRLMTSVGSSLGSIFGAKQAQPTTTNNGDADNQANGGIGLLKVRDNDKGHPALVVDSTVSQVTVVQGDETLDESIPSAPTIQRSIKLGRVDRVTLESDDQLVLLAKPAPTNPKPKELLRFVLLDPHTQAPVTADLRNLCQHHLAVLVEWERQRRIDLDEVYDDDDDDDEDEPNFLRARANKAAHFAKREVEMQQTRRDREKRKAKFSGAGLKYTALAMAGQSS